MEPILKKLDVIGTIPTTEIKPITTIHRKKGIGSAQKTMRRSERIRYNSRAKHEYTDILSRKINQLRRVSKDNINDRNVAIAAIKYSASNIEELTAISGADSKVGLPAPRNRTFETFDIRHDRSCDAEVKILEHLDKQIKVYSKASVYLHSELPVCDSCRHVIQQFKDRHKDMKIFTSYSLLDQL